MGGAEKEFSADVEGNGAGAGECDGEGDGVGDGASSDFFRHCDS